MIWKAEKDELEFKLLIVQDDDIIDSRYFVFKVRGKFTEKIKTPKEMADSQDVRSFLVDRGFTVEKVDV